VEVDAGAQRVGGADRGRRQVNAYREAALVVVDPVETPPGWHPPKRLRDGSSVEITCKPPGRWARWWYGIPDGAVWTCGCGLRWKKSEREYYMVWEKQDLPNGGDP